MRRTFYPYPECHKVRSEHSEFFQILIKVRIWWYNILRKNDGSISHIFQLDTINSESILLTAKLVALKRENREPMLKVEITEWRKFVDSFYLSIEDDPSRVGKNEIKFSNVGYIPKPSSVKFYISRHHLDKYFIL